MEFFTVLVMFAALSENFKQPCIVWPSYASLSILISVKGDNHLVSASRYSFGFEDLIGFWSSNAGINGLILEPFSKNCDIFGAKNEKKIEILWVSVFFQKHSTKNNFEK